MNSLIGRIIISLVVTGVIWTVTTWPLPKFVTTGIPSSGLNIEQPAFRSMIPGDHLQLLYHYWLFSDMLKGETPWLHNLYEFNKGIDHDRFIPRAYFFPFSFIYAAFQSIGSRALAWNLTGFLSLWLTLLSTWHLVYRLTASKWSGLIIACITFMLPYRWMSLLGGSPAGFAMLWVPVIMLGMESAIRRGKASGGFLAGSAWLFACWTDLHVFYFSSLLVPFWAILCVLWPDPNEITETKRGGAFSRVLHGVWPIAIFAIAIIGYVRFTQSQLSGSLMSKGRSISETLIYSEALSAFWHTDSWNFIGFALPFLLLACIAASIYIGLKCGYTRKLAIVWAFLVIAIILCGILASGSRGPFNGLFFQAVRSGLPYYEMIRQPAKILTILPGLLAATLAAGLLIIGNSDKIRSFPRLSRYLTGTAILAIVAWEYTSAVRPTIALLEDEQGAYQAVADDALMRGETPRALVIILWPGDSHYASVYQHYASLYRIRLLNGYSPSVPTAYFEEVFRRFQSMNQGDIRPDQLDDLLSRGIRHLILHEDLFPAQVSPFRVAHTLHQLLNAPRLHLLEQDGPVWAFRILEEPVYRPPIFAGWNTWFPTRIWHAHQLHQETRLSTLESTTGAYVLLEAERRVSTRLVRVHPVHDLRWMLRVQGHGTLRIEEISSEQVILSQTDVRVEADDWQWLEVRAEHVESGQNPRALHVSVEDNHIGLSTVLLTAGIWHGLDSSLTHQLPAPLFFHDGYTDLDTGTIHLRANYDRADIIFHGPNMPLAAGDYLIEMDFTSPAPAGTHLGDFRVVHAHSPDSEWVPVQNGSTSSIFWNQPDNHLFGVQFRYNRSADLQIERVRIQPIP